MYENSYFFIDSSTKNCFHYKYSQLKYHVSKIAGDYEHNQDTSDALKKNDWFVDDEKFEYDEIDESKEEKEMNEEEKKN